MPTHTFSSSPSELIRAATPAHISLRNGKLPEFSENKTSLISWFINIELVGFALIPLLATFMARGIGLP